MDAIVARGITKTFRIGVGRARVREMIPPPFDRGLASLFPRWWARNTFNALEEVSVTVPEGASVGMVGHNGAGKTTLLKIIAGVTAPTAGSTSTSGRVGALLDVLTGFHPDLTGRENAYLFGAVHGLGRRAMSSRIGMALEFAEIDELADTPIKRFSTGMQARLGFSVLVAVEPEILLIDEVLAVGDAAFQRKCMEWLDEFRARGGTLVFVSHNLGLVRSMTESAVWLDHGRVRDQGPTPQTLARYAKGIERRDATDTERQHVPGMRAMKTRGMYRWGAGGARVEEVHVEEPAGDGGGWEVRITYESAGLDRAIFCVGFVDDSGREIGAAASPPLPIEGRRGVVRCSIHPEQLRSGIYFPVAAILSTEGRVEDRWRLDRAMVVDLDGEPALAEDFGPVRIGAEWSEGG